MFVLLTIDNKFLDCFVSLHGVITLHSKNYAALCPDGFTDKANYTCCIIIFLCKHFTAHFMIELDNRHKDQSHSFLSAPLAFKK